MRDPAKGRWSGVRPRARSFPARRRRTGTAFPGSAARPADPSDWESHPEEWPKCSAETSAWPHLFLLGLPLRPTVVFRRLLRLGPLLLDRLTVNASKMNAALCPRVTAAASRR